MNIRYSAIVSGLTTLVSLPHPVVQAQSIVTLEPVIVTAKLTETDQAHIPYAADVISERELRQQNVRSVPDALRNTPGVMIQKTATGQGSPFIRGFTGYRTVGLIDGIRINNSVFREGPNQYWSQIDPLSLDRIEVAKGTNSVLFGTDAIGGGINCFTRGANYVPAPSGPPTTGKGPVPTGTASPEAPVTVGGALRGRYASGENSYQSRAEGYVSQDKNYGAYVGVTTKTFGDVRAADLGTLPYTGFDEYSIDGKLEWWLDPDTKFTLAHQEVKQSDIWRTHRTVYSLPWAGSAPGTEQAHLFDQERFLTYARLEGGDGEGWLDHYTITLSHHRQTEDRFRIRPVGDDRRDQEGFSVDSWGVAWELKSDSPIGQLTYGVDTYFDQVDSYQRSFGPKGEFLGDSVQGPVADDSSYLLVGAYIQDEIALSERTSLTVGGRFTHARAEADGVGDPLDADRRYSLSDDWSTAVGQIRLAQHLNDEKNSLIYTAVSQGFRAPNLSDLTRLDSARSGELETPSEGLDPETFIGYEVGFKGKWQTVTTEVAAFYTDIDGMIVRQPTGSQIDGLNEVRKRNAGDGYLYGVEMSLAWEFVPQWTGFGTFAWQDGKLNGYPTSEDKRMEEPISRLLPASTLAGLRWQGLDGKVWVEGSAQFVETADRLSAGDLADTQRIPPGGTPGYTVVALRMGWNMTDQVNLSVGVENLLDEAYRVHGSGQNEPGINAVIGLDVTF